MPIRRDFRPEAIIGRFFLFALPVTAYLVHKLERDRSYDKIYDDTRLRYLRTIAIIRK